MKEAINKANILSILRIMFKLLFVFHVAGCTNHMLRADKPNDIQGLYSNKRGVVIIQSAYKNNEKSSEQYSVVTTWLKASEANEKQSKFFDADPNNTAADIMLGLLVFPRGLFNYKTMICFIEPGFYALYKISFEVDKNYKYSADLSDVILSFEIKGGEVVYLGKIVANNKSKLVVNALNIEDDYKGAVKYFKKRYPSITKEPIKRILQFTREAEISRAVSKEYGVFDAWD